MTARSAKPGAKSGAKPTQRCGGIFQPDPDVPADPLTGAMYCRCGLAGRSGDAHHALPAAGPEQAEHLRRYEHEENPDGL